MCSKHRLEQTKNTQLPRACHAAGRELHKCAHKGTSTAHCGFMHLPTHAAYFSRHVSSRTHSHAVDNAGLAHICHTLGDLAGVQELIEKDGVDANAPGASNRTALHRAAGTGAVDVVRYLLRCGAQLEAKDR